MTVFFIIKYKYSFNLLSISLLTKCFIIFTKYYRKLKRQTISLPHYFQTTMSQLELNLRYRHWDLVIHLPLKLQRRASVQLQSREVCVLSHKIRRIKRAFQNLPIIYKVQILILYFSCTSYKVLVICLVKRFFSGTFDIFYNLLMLICFLH